MGERVDAPSTATDNLLFVLFFQSQGQAIIITVQLLSPYILLHVLLHQCVSVYIGECPLNFSHNSLELGKSHDTCFINSKLR